MSREAAVIALEDLVAGAYPWATPPSRRLRLWDSVPVEMRPACFLFEGGKEGYVWQQGVEPRVEIEVRLFVYIDAKDPSVVGSSALNVIMDALDAAMAKGQGREGRNTLGGAAFWARIAGDPFKDPGDIDGDGLLIVPIKITL
jgi:hypothetical protein